MKKSLFFKILSALVITVLVLNMFTASVSALEPQAKVSEIGYDVKLAGMVGYMCNLRPIDGEIGTEMYITYTVASGSTEAYLQGVVGTDDPSAGYPYFDGGFLYYTDGKSDVDYLLKPGNTYFMKFTVIEGGFEFLIGYANEEEDGWKRLIKTFGDGTDKMQYFGLFYDGGSTGITLTNVHIYDKEGNDLGVGGRNNSSVRVFTEPIKNATHINHKYNIIAENVYDIYLYNKIMNKTDEMYIEYTCVDYSIPEGQKGLDQTGVRLNAHSTNFSYSVCQFPHTNHLLNNNLETPDRSPLLVPGAKYIILLEYTGVDSIGWDATVQRTLGGVTEWFKFQHPYGTVNAGLAGYSALYFGESHLFRGSFELKDFKIYDANGKHLGTSVSGNGSIEVIHEGEVVDYRGCNNLYYNKKLDQYIAVYPDQTIEVTKDGKTKSGTYSIQDSENAVLVAKMGGETVEYQYKVTYMIDSDGNQYDALAEYQLSFVTGTDEEIETQYFNTKNGYKPSKPNDPTLKGDEFLGWVTSDGKEFDFNTIMSESVTLYAKWKYAGNVYEKTTVSQAVDMTPIIAIGLSVVILAAGAVFAVFFIKKSKKNM